MGRDVLNISGGSFKKICIFRYNKGGDFQNIYCSNFLSIQRILMQLCMTIDQTMSYLYVTVQSRMFTVFSKLTASDDVPVCSCRS